MFSPLKFPVISRRSIFDVGRDSDRGLSRASERFTPGYPGCLIILLLKVYAIYRGQTIACWEFMEALACNPPRAGAFLITIKAGRWVSWEFPDEFQCFKEFLRESMSKPGKLKFVEFNGFKKFLISGRKKNNIHRAKRFFMLCRLRGLILPDL